MNIGQMAKTLIGETRPRPQDSRELALRDGQVVRGVVLQLLDGQEALISVEGVRIRAVLETPLQVGQAAWLQVQSPLPDGRIHLKAITPISGLVAEDVIVKLLQQLGLQDHPVHREMMRQVQELGIRLRPEEARQLSAFLLETTTPEHADGHQAARWIQSAVIARQRGLPLTETTVSSIGRVLYDRPLPEQLSNIHAQLTRLLDHGHSGGSALPDPARALLVKLADAVGQWLALSAVGRALNGSAHPADGASSAADGRSNQAGAMPHAAQPSTDEGPETARSSVEPAARASNERGAQSVSFRTGGEGNGNMRPGPAANEFAMRESVASSAVTLNTARGDRPAGSSGPVTEAGNNAPANPPSGINGNRAAYGTPAENVNLTARQQGAAGAVHHADAPAASGSLIKQLLLMLGFGHEHELLEKLYLHRQTSQAEGNPGLMPATAAAEQAESGLLGSPASPSSAESIKSLLMQSAALEQLPAALRESMQQAAQTITGQQLLLSADRSAPLAHVTLFVPLYNERGEPFATVHVHTRRDRRGRLDGDNCNLYFDLHLATLGDMVIDVQVTKRIVSLRIYNNHPAIERLVSEGKEPMQRAIEQLGYRLSHLKTMPFPEPAATAAEDRHPDAQNQLVRLASASSYRGVDIRI